MAPAPMCKTAIVSFLVDKDTVPKLWNLSSNMRKRLQMVMEEMKITLREYNEKILKIKEWISIGKKGKFIKSIKDIKKGISNYELRTQKQADRVVAFNGKLRCYELCFRPEVPIEVDYVEHLVILDKYYHFYSKFSFNRIGKLNLNKLSSSQIKDIINRAKRIRHLRIYSCFVSELDLSSLRISIVRFSFTTFETEVKLFCCLNYLKILRCDNLHFLKFNRTNKLKLLQEHSQDAFKWLKSLKGVKEANISRQFSRLTDYLPNTVRILGSQFKFDFENIDLPALKKKFPFLIRINKPIPIEATQTLNLRNIEPIMSEAEEKFNVELREIKVNKKNVDELNKRPELFKKVEKVRIDTNRFNYDCLPAGVKEIRFDDFSNEEEKLESLEKNNWKFAESVIDIRNMQDKEARKMLRSLDKVKKIILSKSLYDAKKLGLESFQFKFDVY